MGVISEGKAALELTRELVSYLKKAGEHDPKLMGMFEDLREKVLSLYESDIELRQQVRELEEKLKIQDEVFWDQNLGAYFTGTFEDPKGGPFCGKCFHNDNGLVPMRKVNKAAVGFGDLTGPIAWSYDYLWICPLCETKIKRI